jgi:hypothetical protein
VPGGRGMHGYAYLGIGGMRSPAEALRCRAPNPSCRLSLVGISPLRRLLFSWVYLWFLSAFAGVVAHCCRTVRMEGCYHHLQCHRAASCRMAGFMSMVRVACSVFCATKFESWVGLHACFVWVSLGVRGWFLSTREEEGVRPLARPKGTVLH